MLAAATLPSLVASTVVWANPPTSPATLSIAKPTRVCISVFVYLCVCVCVCVYVCICVCMRVVVVVDVVLELSVWMDRECMNG